VKDPFVELAKGSLNTFLNAMTFPEKTMYPVASVNDADFKNLMAVYMDAVLKPNIYTNEKIFLQEGWHYELTEPEGELTYNGVVYNEMRGAFSDPESVLERTVLNGLFPDTNYAFESGGEPSAIPDLTYEEFLNFHRRFYHPSNSYIYLYGDMDLCERLQWLDSEYLSRYEAIDPKTEIALQAPFEELREERELYSISEEDEETCYFSWAKVVNGLFDPVKSMAFEVLSYALLNAPGAPLKQALLDAGIGDDIYGGYDSSVRQPYFSVVAKGAAEEDLPRFKEIIDSVLGKCAAEGLSEKTIRAGIHNLEFTLREGDFGRMPKGLVWGLTAIETWLHDELTPMTGLKYEAALAELKEKVGTGWFEELIRELLLKNTHGLILTLQPKKGLNEEKDLALKEKLENYKNSLSPEERQRIIGRTEALKLYQSEPTPKEDLLKIPLLELSEIGKEARGFVNEPMSIGDTAAVYHNVHSQGIAYLELRFGLDAFPEEDLPYLALLKNLYTQMDTENFGYPELNDEIGISSGGIGCSVLSYAMAGDPDTVKAEFGVGAKCLYSEAEATVALLREIMLRTAFTDEKRLKELISEARSQMQNGLVSGGHQTAFRRALSYVIPAARCDEILAGLDFYRFLNDLEKNFESRKDGLIRKLTEIGGKLFRNENACFSVACDTDGIEGMKAALLPLSEALSREEIPAIPLKPALIKKNEGIMASSQVQYVCAAGDMRAAGFGYTGELEVLRTILSYEYLWLNLRVKGGAYGCMASFRRNGSAAFVSYRDPNLGETLEVYRALPEYLRSLEIDDRDMRKYIIGTISDIDAPLTPSTAAIRSLSAYKSGIREEDIQKERDEILSTTVEKLRALAEPMERLLAGNVLAVVGGENKIRENSGLFGALTTLNGDGNE